MNKKDLSIKLETVNTLLYQWFPKSQNSWLTKLFISCNISTVTRKSSSGNNVDFEMDHMIKDFFHSVINIMIG